MLATIEWIDLISTIQVIAFFKYRNLTDVMQLKRIEHKKTFDVVKEISVISDSIETHYDALHNSTSESS